MFVGRRAEYIEGERLKRSLTEDGLADLEIRGTCYLSVRSSEMVKGGGGENRESSRWTSSDTSAWWQGSPAVTGTKRSSWGLRSMSNVQNRVLQGTGKRVS